MNNLNIWADIAQSLAIILIVWQMIGIERRVRNIERSFSITRS